MAFSRKGGIIYLKLNGVQRDATGVFTAHPGTPKREMVVGADSVHGYTEVPQPAYIDGEITKDSGFTIAELNNFMGNVMLQLGDGTVLLLRDGVSTSEGTYMTEKGNIKFRVEGKELEEVQP